MTAFSCFGHCAISTSRVVAVGLALSASLAAASPAPSPAPGLGELVEGPLHEWLSGIAQPTGNAYDVQIFTEISPLLDSPHGVRLPDGVQPEDALQQGVVE